MIKIKISKISEEVYSRKGFDDWGCFGCRCEDICCVYGADVDKESYDLILEHKAAIENMSRIKFADFFEDTWSGDQEFLGGNSIRSKVAKTGFCVFHVPDDKGCILFKVAIEQSLPVRIIPSICRLFPITWNNGMMEYYGREEILATCNCLSLGNKTEKSIFETQQEAIADIFEINPSL